jgi:hypothetical protein
MRRSPRLPKRFPVGTKYILESYGGLVRRYIEYPSGRRIELETRKALSCGCFDSSIVPELDADILNSEPGAHFPKPSFQSSVMTPDRPNIINGDCRVFRACRT